MSVLKKRWYFVLATVVNLKEEVARAVDVYVSGSGSDSNDPG